MILPTPPRSEKISNFEDQYWRLDRRAQWPQSSNPRWRSRTVNRFNVTSAMSAQTVVGIAALILLMVDELALSADGR
jgi:hypothetical protein